VLNRAVLILRYKQPFVDWINAADPNPTHEITLADANDDSTAYLVEVEDEEEFEEWFKLNGLILFEEELNGWYTDPELWPQDRSAQLFKQWCTFELHTLVYDTGGPPLFDDEAPGDSEA
jgi:hypothetical protein